MSARVLLVLLAAVLAAAGPAAAHERSLPPFLDGAGGAGPVPAAAPGCPQVVDDRTFATTAELLADNRVMAQFGPRPTASPAHAEFVHWIENRLAEIPGIETDDVEFEVDRWLERGATLQAGPGAGALLPVRTSGAVPYSRATRNARGTLVHVPAETPLNDPGLAGKVIVRDVVPGRTPYRNYNAVQWSKYDPDLSLTRAEATGAASESDATGANRAMVADLEAAQALGAAGVIFVHGLPHEQVVGHYAPYDGIHWRLPALFVGADEGERLKALAAQAGRARLSVRAEEDPGATTRMLVATLPGTSSERFVVQSHTDGVNALWDNGPIAMLALARHFAALPRECRPRTLQFVFTTAHLYQYLSGEGGPKGGSAEVLARQLDDEYEKGSVGAVFALEHLGAREYEAVPRTDGGAGRVLVPTGRTEVNTFFSGESPAIVSAAQAAIARRDVARTYLLRGADAPGARVPPHQSFGGEGGSYHRRLIPTFAFITGPWTLFKPAFGLEAIDGDLMRRQTLVFADAIHALADVPNPVLGGGYVAERAARSLLCSSALSTMGLTTCD